MLATRNVWVLFDVAPDVPGLWTAHCLDWDLVTQGTSLAHAVAMMVELLALTVTEDVLDGRHRDRAPTEDWQTLERVLAEGAPLDLGTALLISPEGPIASQVRLEFSVAQDVQQPPRPLPMVWAAASSAA